MVLGPEALVRDTRQEEKRKLTRGWKVSLGVTPFGTVNGWSNIMHATLGRNLAEYGDRTPGIWFHSGTTKLHICSAVNGNKNYCFNSDPIPLNEESKIIVQQIQAVENNPQYTYEILINGEKVLSVFNDKPENFEYVKYYTSDPWYQAAKVAEINDLAIETYKHTGKFFILLNFKKGRKNSKS